MDGPLMTTSNTSILQDDPDTHVPKFLILSTIRFCSAAVNPVVETVQPLISLIKQVFIKLMLSSESGSIVGFLYRYSIHSGFTIGSRSFIAAYRARELDVTLLRGKERP